jgi:hypothetical protein
VFHKVGCVVMLAIDNGLDVRVVGLARSGGFETRVLSRIGDCRVGCVDSIKEMFRPNSKLHGIRPWIEVVDGRFVVVVAYGDELSSQFAVLISSPAGELQKKKQSAETQPLHVFRPVGCTLIHIELVLVRHRSSPSLSHVLILYFLTARTAKSRPANINERKARAHPIQAARNREAQVGLEIDTSTRLG